MLNDLTRRKLLQTGLAGAAGAAAVGTLGRAHPLGAADAAPAAEKPGIHFGMVTYMVGANMDLARLIDVCEKSGMEGVELRTTHKHGVEPSLDAAGRAKVRALFAKTKVRLRTLGSVCEFHSPDPEAVKKNIETAKEFVTLAVDVGAWGVKVRPNGLQPDVEKTLKQIGESIAQVGEFARPKGIAVVVEMHGKGSSDPPNMAKVMQYCNNPNVGLTWNSNADDAKDGSIKANFDLCKQWIRHCHVRDLTKPDYPWQELVTLLKGINYNGYMMFEGSSKEDPVAFLTKERETWEKLMAS
jgi:sugar phosphate isomerase/epimerase